MKDKMKEITILHHKIPLWLLENSSQKELGYTQKLFK